MVKKCLVVGCGTMKAGDGITMHGFPADENLRALWLKILANHIEQTELNEEDKICSKHFSPDHFEVENEKTILKSLAVPSNFPTGDFEELKPSSKRFCIDQTVSKCSVFSCKNSIGKTETCYPNLTYYKFPEDNALKILWKQFCKTDDDCCNCYVCSDHFAPDDFVSLNADSSTGVQHSKILKSNVIPSIYKTEFKKDLAKVVSEYHGFQDGLIDSAQEKEENTIQQPNRICAIEMCDTRTRGRAAISYYPKRPEEDRLDLDNERFVRLLKHHSVILNPSAAARIRFHRVRAFRKLSCAYRKTFGKSITRQRVLKKIDEMKNDIREKITKIKKTSYKQGRLKKWEEDFIKLLKSRKIPINGLIQLGGPEERNARTTQSLVNLVPHGIHRRYSLRKIKNAELASVETRETEFLSDEQLRRLLNLEQLKLIRLQQLQSEKEIERLKLNSVSSSTRRNRNE